MPTRQSDSRDDARGAAGLLLDSQEALVDQLELASERVVEEVAKRSSESVHALNGGPRCDVQTSQGRTTVRCSRRADGANEKVCASVGLRV